MSKKNNGGRPRKEIDFELVDNLLGIMCTGEEVASILEVDYDTLNARIKEKYKVGFSDYVKQKQAKGNLSRGVLMTYQQMQTARSYYDPLPSWDNP